MKNNELFGVFAAQIFASTYESFPVAIRIPREDMSALMSAQTDTVNTERKVSTRSGMQTLLVEAGVLSKEAVVAATAKLDALNEQLNGKKAEAKRIADVLEGAIFALTAEGFIREREPGFYQLTFKGLAHLSKPFGTGEGQPSIAERILNALNPANFVGSVTSGTLINLVGRAIGGS